MRQIKNKICVGLDLEDNTCLFKIYKIIEQTKKYAYCYKINPAFYLDNIKVFNLIIDYLNTNNLKWIYDGKLGDVKHTNIKYSKHIYENLNAWGTTLNPYVGKESLEPFFDFKNKINFLLCRTTNNKSEFIQNHTYKKVYKMAEHLKSGLVVPANKIDYLNDAIKNNPETLILSPGIGAQGGKILTNNKNIIYSISRSIINSNNVEEEILKYVY